MSHAVAETKELKQNVLTSRLCDSNFPVLSEDYSAELLFDEEFQQHQRDEMQ